MKRVFAWAAAHLVADCYLLALALWALWALGNAGWDALGFATGRLTTVEVPLSSLQSQDVALTDEGLWVTTGADPQFHLELGQPVRSVLFATDAPWADQRADVENMRRFVRDPEVREKILWKNAARLLRISV